jgi:hypothetical protein
MTPSPWRASSAPYRGQRVILDADLARIYGVETKILNKAVSRNKGRFPGDFVFRLTAEEFSALRFQNGTSNVHPPDNEAVAHGEAVRFQIGTASRRNIRYLPWAFTEHGAMMAANVLRSRRAVEMSVFVVRAFVKMREQLLGRSEMEKRLLQIENILLSHDDSIRDLYNKLRPLLLPPKEPEKKPIGFQVRERRAQYGGRRR